MLIIVLHVPLVQSRRAISLSHPKGCDEKDSPCCSLWAAGMQHQPNDTSHSIAGSAAVATEESDKYSAPSPH